MKWEAGKLSQLEIPAVLERVGWERVSVFAALNPGDALSVSQLKSWAWSHEVTHVLAQGWERSRSREEAGPTCPSARVSPWTGHVSSSPACQRTQEHRGGCQPTPLSRFHANMSLVAPPRWRPSGSAILGNAAQPSPAHASRSHQYPPLTLNCSEGGIMSTSAHFIYWTIFCWAPIICQVLKTGKTRTQSLL